MKVLILAGGLGTRLAEETTLRPKPMVEIGGRPILWHIMKIYSHYGFNEFIVLTGYKSHVIKEYFINYYTRYSDITIDMATNTLDIHAHKAEPWKVTMLYTGADNMTGSRIAQAKEYINNESFMLTYGDGVSDIDINKLLAFHKSHKRAITMSAIQPDGKFGALNLNNDKITSFTEKPKGDSVSDNNGWINGGFFVCEPKVMDYLSVESSLVFEQEPLKRLANDGELYAYKHRGFWRCMDTLRDKNELCDMWLNDRAPWAVWKNS